MSPDENKREKFIRIATRRTNRVLNELRKLGNCSNRKVYEYNEEDARKILRVIKKELDRIEALFSSSDAQEFSLEE